MGNRNFKLRNTGWTKITSFSGYFTELKLDSQKVSVHFLLNMVIAPLQPFYLYMALGVERAKLKHDMSSSPYVPANNKDITSVSCKDGT